MSRFRDKNSALYLFRFFDVRDPDCRDEFFKLDAKLYAIHFRYRLGSAKSPEWCSYLMGKLKGILDEYDFDGIYNDMGYDETVLYREQGIADDSFPYDLYIEDLLCQIYSMVKERGGISKIHIGWNQRPTTKDKVYDYLWVGESVTDPKSMLMTIPYEPYVIPCQDYKTVTDETCADFYAQTLPFMQFPLRVDGRPLTDDKVTAEGVDYLPSPLTDFFADAAKWYKSHPNGPYVYSEWSSIPDNVANRELWAKYLKLYKPMVEENNIVHLNVTESTLTKAKLPKDVYMSLFTGVEQYICISNLGEKVQTVAFEDEWQDCESGELLTEITLAPKRVRFLKIRK